jgi:DUF438 domain-containing protein
MVKPSEKVSMTLGAHLLFTMITVPGVGSRPFVLLPDDDDPKQLVLWVSESDEEESKFVDAAKILHDDILADVQKRNSRVSDVRLVFD